MMQFFESTLRAIPQPLLGLAILLVLLGTYSLGRRVRLRQGVDPAPDETRQMFDGFIVSAVLGLLALLLGFTFSMAVERYDQRFQLVVDEANAISSTYLLAQTLDEPHQSRLSGILSAYADNRLKLGQSEDLDRTKALLAESEAMQTCLWAASVAAVGNLRDDISSNFLDNARETIEVAGSRVSARLWHIPARVHGVLLIYMMVTGFVLGFVFAGARQHIATAALFVLLTMSMLLIIDLDRPTGGRIVEPEQPMQALLWSMRQNPPAKYKAFSPPAAAIPTADEAPPPPSQSSEWAGSCHDAQNREQPRQ